MEIYIAKNLSEVEPYIDLVQSHADKNKNALGFLPASAYKEQAYKNQLWVAICVQTKTPLGHLLFGGRFPNLKVIQILAYPESQHMGVAKKLIKELVFYGEENNYLSISARVAADLDANMFWEKINFGVVKQEKGGKTKDRNINVRVRELDSMTLFKGLYTHAKPDSKEKSLLTYIDRPLSTNPTYAIDLNIFFDVAKRRSDFDEANEVIRAGFNNKIKLCVTNEFIRELERTSISQTNDVLLNFARNLPVLPNIPQEESVGMIEELREIIFPYRSREGRNAPNDASDLIHLASCIHHRLYGFITREKAILIKSAEIKDIYGIDVISPIDLVDGTNDYAISKISVNCEGDNISITDFDEIDRIEVEKFILLNEKNSENINEVLSPSTTGNKRRRLIAKVRNVIVGIITWSLPDFRNSISRAFIFVDEYYPEIRKIIDHFLETLSRDVQSTTLTRINLHICSLNEEILEAAIGRGFRKISNKEGGVLSKITYLGPLFQLDWLSFSQEYEELTGLKLPIRMPTYEEFINTGIIIDGIGKDEKLKINLFDFETLHSPAIFLCKKRTGVIMPIRKEYAYELFRKSVFSKTE